MLKEAYSMLVDSQLQEESKLWKHLLEGLWLAQNHNLLMVNRLGHFLTWDWFRTKGFEGPSICFFFLKKRSQC